MIQLNSIQLKNFI